MIVAWYMKQPPALDDKLSNNALSMLKFAPLVFLFNGYWMLSNVQIFQNKWHYIAENTEKMSLSIS